MYPTGWDEGPPPWRPSFQDFQKFTEEERIEASRLGLGRHREWRFNLAMNNRRAANDDMANNVTMILVHEPLMEMLACWEMCGRDMVRTRLTYDPDQRYHMIN
jgi:hypothetical protein